MELFSRIKFQLNKRCDKVLYQITWTHIAEQIDGIKILVNKFTGMLYHTYFPQKWIPFSPKCIACNLILRCWYVDANGLFWCIILTMHHQFSSARQSTRILCASTGQLSGIWENDQTVVHQDKHSEASDFRLKFSDDHLHGIIPDNCPVNI